MTGSPNGAMHCCRVSAAGCWADRHHPTAVGHVLATVGAALPCGSKVITFFAIVHNPVTAGRHLAVGPTIGVGNIGVVITCNTAWVSEGTATTTQTLGKKLDRAPSSHSSVPATIPSPHTVHSASASASVIDTGPIFGEHHGGGDCGAGRPRDEEGQPPTGLPRS